MKYITSILSLTLFLSLSTASPMQARQAYDAPTPTTPVSTPSASATCTCEQVICIQQWPQSCTCANKGKLDCYNKCGGSYPELQKCDA